MKIWWHEVANSLLALTEQTFVALYTYFVSHYYYYSGSAMRMIQDYDKFTKRQLAKHIPVSIILIDANIRLMEYHAYPPGAVLLCCLVVGYAFDSVLRFILHDLVEDIGKAIKARVLRFFS